MSTEAAGHTGLLVTESFAREVMVITSTPTHAPRSRLRGSYNWRRTHRALAKARRKHIIRGTAKVAALMLALQTCAISRR